MPKSTPKPDYVKTLTDQQWASASLSERALHVASSQMDVKEVGANWGPMVKIYLAVAGLFTPAPWCASFVTWCLVQAGADRKKLPKFAGSTYYWWQWAKDAHRDNANPKRGRLFVWNDKGGGHIGFVAETLVNGSYRTIEGNTNDDGGREGYKVAGRIRKQLDIIHHVRWTFIEIGDELY